MPNKPTAADAELILKLYDLRREAEMRKARSWCLADFWPESSDDLMKLAMNPKLQENHWIRQVLGYWDMAAMLVLHNTLNESMFLELSFSGEMFMIFAKLKPFLAEIRQKMQNTEFLGNVEKLITRSKLGRDRLQFFEGRVAARRKAMQEQAAKAAQ
jgi:hypothetical protein